MNMLSVDVFSPCQFLWGVFGWRNSRKLFMELFLLKWIIITEGNVTCLLRDFWLCDSYFCFEIIPFITCHNNAFGKLCGN